MKYILASLMLFTQNVWAHCPIPFQVESNNYCMNVEWLNGEKQVKGKFEPSDLMSPYLNKEGEIPQKWIYSKALIKIWVDGDKSHVPVALENFRIFPYMVMADTMHHEASAQFSYDESLGGYVVSGFSLQEMEGCWSLRWMVSTSVATSTSPLLDITSYSNLTDEENALQVQYCGGELPVNSGGHTHHH